MFITIHTINSIKFRFSFVIFEVKDNNVSKIIRTVGISIKEPSRINAVLFENCKIVSSIKTTASIDKKLLKIPWN